MKILDEIYEIERKYNKIIPPKIDEMIIIFFLFSIYYNFFFNFFFFIEVLNLKMVYSIMNIKNHF